MDIKKITPNLEMTKNILSMTDLIEERIKVQDREKMSSLIISDYYEIIKELITAILLIDGYKTLSHKELIEYLKSNYKEFNQGEIINLDNLRILRNRISYEGYKINKLYLENNEDFFKTIIKKLKIIINSKLNPFYIIIRGPLGIGKSTIATHLAKELNAEHISIDSIVDNSDLHKDKEQGYISQKSFIKANDISIKQAKKLLKTKPVIFDGNFYWKSQIDDLISKLNHQHYVFTLKAPLETCIERDNKRKNSYGKDAAKVVYKKSTSFDYGDVIDTENKSVEEVVKEIKERLK